MAECKQTSQEFIKNAFPPMVAALCSHDAELICKKNNLSFCELIQPFCHLTTEAHIRDANNISHAIRNLRLSVKEMNSQVPNPTATKKLLHEAVASCQPPTTTKNVVTFGQYDLQFNVTTPWYENYRDTFLQTLLPSDHEFLKHYLACLFVVSSNHAEPLDQFTKLTQQQHNQQHGQSSNQMKWFCPNVLRYYVLLHDVSDGDMAKAETVYQGMKTTYGMNSCHLLQINSHTVPTVGESDGTQNNAAIPNPWSHFLSKKGNSTRYEPVVADNIASPTQSASFPGQLIVENNIDAATEAVEGNTDSTIEESSVSSEATSPVNDHPLSDTPNPAIITDSMMQSGTLSTSESCTSINGMDQPPSSMGSTPNISLSMTTSETSMVDMDTQSTRDNDIDSVKDNNGTIGDPGITFEADSGCGVKASAHGSRLSLSDHDRLRIFIHEFITRGLIPWSERTLRTLSEQLASRKGIHRSFFSATKKLFGGNKPASPQALMERANVVYTPEAPEMQMRRLADLAFMFQLYELAYQTYHTAKRDFNTDHAWLYYAGALEMAAVSVFLQSPSNRQYPQSYMDTAVSTYLTTCRSAQFSTRSTLLCTEALKSKGLYSEAAVQFVKMTSEDSDLRSALLLEQAAHCFIKSRHAMVRKYAFHMILAGHRFSKSNQKQHALRCYMQALQVYKGKGWGLAVDHINFTIGRHSCYLRQLDSAVSAFGHLLTPDSKQSVVQQAAFLKEYLIALRQQTTSVNQPADLPQLPLPIVEANETKLFLDDTTHDKNSSVPNDDDNNNTANWCELEEACVKACHGHVSPTFKPTLQCYSHRTNNAHNPIAVQAERVCVEVTISNPFKVALVLTDVMLLWQFVPAEWDKPEAQQYTGDVVTNKHYQGTEEDQSDLPVSSEVIPEIVLSGNEKRPLQLHLKPTQTGELHITGLVYSISCSTLSNSASTNLTMDSRPQVEAHRPPEPRLPAVNCSVRGHQQLEMSGPRLNNTKQEMSSQLYGPDRRLDLIVTNAMPQLQISLDLPRSLICGEVQRVSIQLVNNGSLPLHNLYVSSSHTKFFTFAADHNSSTQSTSSVYAYTQSESESTLSTTHPGSVLRVPVPNGQIDGGASVTIPMWIRGPDTPDTHKVLFLFYYESLQSSPKMRHRVLQHSAVLEVSPCLALQASVQRSEEPKTPTAPCSNTHNNGMTVALQLDNIASQMDIRASILQVSAVSKLWTLQQLSTEQSADISINSRESGFMCFKAERCKHNCDVDNNDFVFSNVVFDKQQIDSGSPPCMDFFMHSMPNVNKNKSTFRQQDLMTNSHHKELVQHIADVNQATEANMALIVLWKASLTTESGDKQIITGQHHLNVQQINTIVKASPEDKTTQEHPPVQIISLHDSSNESRRIAPHVANQLLQCTVLCQDVIRHDFILKRLCTHKIYVQVTNCCKVSLKVRLHAKSNRSASTLHTHSASKFTWIGCTSVHLTLEPFASNRLSMTACFSKSGVYDLSSLVVTAAPENKLTDLQMTEQRITSQTMVTVMQQQIDT